VVGVRGGDVDHVDVGMLEHLRVGPECVADAVLIGERFRPVEAAGPDRHDLVVGQEREVAGELAGDVPRGDDPPADP